MPVTALGIVKNERVNSVQDFGNDMEHLRKKQITKKVYGTV